MTLPLSAGSSRRRRARSLVSSTTLISTRSS
jgi:hypothetical protein